MTSTKALSYPDLVIGLTAEHQSIKRNCNRIEIVCVCACIYLIRMGCGTLDYRQQAQQMELRTGGMSVSTQVIPDSTQLDTFEQVSAGTAARKCSFTSVLTECSFHVRAEKCFFSLIAWLNKLKPFDILKPIFASCFRASSCSPLA